MSVRDHRHLQLVSDRPRSYKKPSIATTKFHWTQAEEDRLVSLSGSSPFPILVSRFQNWAATNNYPKRTNSSIAAKICRMRLSRISSDNNFSLNGLAAGLGLTYDSIQSLILAGKLKSKKIKGRYVINRRWAIATVLANPEYFSRCDRDNLFWLLEDDQLVKQVKKTPPSRKGLSKPVRCYKPEGETETYPSVRAAARATYLSNTAIAKAIATKSTSGGMSWEYC